MSTNPKQIQYVSSHYVREFLKHYAAPTTLAALLDDIENLLSREPDNTKAQIALQNVQKASAGILKYRPHPPMLGADESPLPLC